MYVCVCNYLSLNKVWRFTVVDYSELGKVGVRAITYRYRPLPRPKYFISAAGTLPYPSYRLEIILLR
jgi:hypothetical protein